MACPISNSKMLVISMKKTILTAFAILLAPAAAQASESNGIGYDNVQLEYVYANSIRQSMDADGFALSGSHAFSEQKNVPMFLDAVVHLRGRASPIFQMAGVGHHPGDRDTLAQMLLERNITPKEVEVLDWLPRDALLDRMAAASVVVLTSRYESFGYVLAEANCLGVPVVGTDVDGIRDIIEDGCNGFLIASGNAAELADRLAHLLSDTTCWRAMSDFARHAALTRFDMRDAIRRFENYYEACLRDG